MADPLPLAEIFDHLVISTVEWDVVRLDQTSVTGAAESFQGELADPLWKATVSLSTRNSAALNQSAALIRSLRGSQQPFLICNPTALWPQADEGGLLLGASAITVRAIAPNRALALLQGFPPGYVLTPGDKLQITFGAPLRYTFFEVSRTAVANGLGQCDVAVFPWLSMLLPVGASVTLVRPACPVTIERGAIVQVSRGAP